MHTQPYLTPKDHGRRLTLEEFQRAGAREGFRYELIDGRVEVSPIPDFPHADLCQLVRRLLARYAEEHRNVINWVHGPACVFIPGQPAPTALVSDVAAYRVFPADRHRRRICWQDVTPVLVVEVLSADTADKDLVRNRRLYLQVPSVREYWIVDPRQDADRPSLTAYRRRGARWQRPLHVAPGETYSTRLLPGFLLALAGPPPEER
jgi:Uma2 family endonuclease